MSVLIMVDLAQLRPVTNDGLWHRVADELYRMPLPGTNLTLLCGRVETVEYGVEDKQLVALTCWPCDAQYRKACGIPPAPNHRAGDR